jgi:hypothetical protein
VKRVFAATPWIALLGFALFEVGAHALSRSHVASIAEYRAAASFVRAQLQPRDLIVAAPSWADPLVREVLGDRIDVAMAGRSDSAAYERLWALSIRGARPPEAPPIAPEIERRFGQVLVSRWALGSSPVRYDLVEHAAQAEVSVVDRGQPRACRWRQFGPPRGGGLGNGFLPPVERFACERSLWVAPIVLEDVHLLPRRCVLQPPAAGGATRVVFRDVPLAQRIVFYAGLYYEHERMREGGPVLARVLVDGREVGRMQHKDGDGWSRLEIATTPGSAEVAIEVSARKADKRSFCWAATTRSGALGNAR